MTERVLVIVPTYNESENIDALIDAVMALDDSFDLLIVDDGSPDGTGEKAQRRAERSERIHVLRRDRKQGLGRAYISGFSWGLKQNYAALVEMDADFSHDPAVVPTLAGALGEADLVIGSRYVPGGAVEGWSRGRHALSRAGNVYARWMLRFRVTDSTSGFRCYSRAVLESIDLDQVSSEGYAFQIDMTHRTANLGFRIKEVPITFRERRQGYSKMSRAIVAEALWSVTAWGFKALLHTPRRRGTGPPAAPDRRA
jgi:dolichol-phosphate mannosyltransferase